MSSFAKLFVLLSSPAIVLSISPARAAEPEAGLAAKTLSPTVTLGCDKICWRKLQFAPFDFGPGQSYTCMIHIQKAEEATWWQQNKGKLNASASVTMFSQDMQGSTVECPTLKETVQGADRDVRTLEVSGIAWDARFCNMSGNTAVGDTVSVSICGVSNDGNAASFEPVH